MVIDRRGRRLHEKDFAVAHRLAQPDIHFAVGEAGSGTNAEPDAELGGDARRPIPGWPCRRKRRSSGSSVYCPLGEWCDRRLRIATSERMRTSRGRPESIAPARSGDPLNRPAIVIRFSTCVTPGAAHAVLAASLPLGVRGDIAAQGHLAIVSFHPDVLRIELGTAPEGRFNPRLDFGRRCLRLDGDQVRHPVHAEQVMHSPNAASFWYCQSTSPSRVIQPLLTATLICPSGTNVFHPKRVDDRSGDVGVGARRGEPGARLRCRWRSP